MTSRPSLGAVVGVERFVDRSVRRVAGVTDGLDGLPHADDDAGQTRSATMEISQGRTSLTQESVAATVRRIIGKQWTIADVPHRLPGLLVELLAATPPVAPKLTSSDRVERTISWFADLPAKLLYRQRLKSRRAA